MRPEPPDCPLPLSVSTPIATLQDEHQRNRSRWCRSLPELDQWQSSRIVSSLEEVADRAGVRGWDSVAPVLVSLALALVLQAKADPPGQQAAALGRQLLGRVYAAEQEGPQRTQLLLLLQSQLLSATATEPRLQLIGALGDIARENTEAVAADADKLRECLDCLGSLPPEVALPLLLAATPVLRMRKDVLDYAVGNLRRVLVAGGESGRPMAVRGFFYMLVAQARSPDAPVALGATQQGGTAGVATSQRALSQMDSFLGGGANLMQEFLSFLRRCLGQESAVRRHLYQGLEAVLLADKSTVPVVCQLLAPHLTRYYSSDGNESPLLLSRCLTGAQVQEPLPDLLRCLLRTMDAAEALELVQQARARRAAEQAMATGTTPAALPPAPAGAAEALGRLRAMLADIERRLLDCDLAAFDLQPESVFGPQADAGQEQVWAPPVSLVP